MSSRRTGAARAAASLGGRALAATTQALAAVRSAAKPLHPDGEVWSGHVHRWGTSPPVGVPWIDEPGDDDVLVRLSRAIGLPVGMPDIHGLALRVPGRPDDADLLFATTGRGGLARFVLLPTRHAHRWMTTLLPYRTQTGPVLLGVAATSAESFELSWARADGPWQTFGSLSLTARTGDPLISFDPVRRQLAGLRQYPAVTLLREPAYARARRTRD